MINLGSHRDKTWPDGWTAVTEDGKRSAQVRRGGGGAGAAACRASVQGGRQGWRRQAWGKAGGQAPRAPGRSPLTHLRPCCRHRRAV